MQQFFLGCTGPHFGPTNTTHAKNYQKTTFGVLFRGAFTKKKWEKRKNVTCAGPEQPFRCLDSISWTKIKSSASQQKSLHNFLRGLEK